MSEQISSISARPLTSNSIFGEASVNGEEIPVPAAPLPAVPSMPANFVAPSVETHDRPDAARGAEAIG